MAARAASRTFLIRRRGAPKTPATRSNTDPECVGFGRRCLNFMNCQTYVPEFVDQTVKRGLHKAASSRDHTESVRMVPTEALPRIGGKGGDASDKMVQAKTQPQKLFRQRPDQSTCSIRIPSAKWWESGKRSASCLILCSKFVASIHGHKQQHGADRSIWPAICESSCDGKRFVMSPAATNHVKSFSKSSRRD